MPTQTYIFTMSVRPPPSFLVCPPSFHSHLPLCPRATFARRQYRPDDVVVNLGEGRTFADLTIAILFESARVALSRSASTPAAAAALAYNRKVRDWASISNWTAWAMAWNFFYCRPPHYYRAWRLGRAVVPVAKAIISCLRIGTWHFLGAPTRPVGLNDKDFCCILAGNLALIRSIRNDMGASLAFSDAAEGNSRSCL